MTNGTGSTNVRSGANVMTRSDRENPNENEAKAKKADVREQGPSPLPKRRPTRPSQEDRCFFSENRAEICSICPANCVEMSVCSLPTAAVTLFSTSDRLHKATQILTQVIAKLFKLSGGGRSTGCAGL